MKGSLKPRRGVTQSITVHSEADDDTVLREAVRKLTAYGYIEPGEYYLVYPVSYTRVMTIPGEDTPFTVQRYKDDMGAVQFSRVRLLLVAAQDYTTEAKPTGEYWYQRTAGCNIYGQTLRTTIVTRVQDSRNPQNDKRHI